jgi:hypothetical protein
MRDELIVYRFVVFGYDDAILTASVNKFKGQINEKEKVYRDSHRRG